MRLILYLEEMNILFFIPWPIYGAVGGAENVASLLASHLIEQGHKVKILSNDKIGGQLAYPCSDKIILDHFSSDNIKQDIFRSLKTFSPIKARRHLYKKLYILDNLSNHLADKIKYEQPDLILSFSAIGTYILKRAYEHLKKSSTPPIITMFHSTVECVLFKELHICKNSIYRDKIIREKFTTFCQLIEQSSAFIQVLMPSFIKPLKQYMPNANIVCIPNIVPQYIEQSNLLTPTIINVARLTPLKRQHLLIQAFSLIHQKYPEWRVELWGQDCGDYTNTLKLMIKNLGLTKKVILCGTAKEIKDRLLKASIFCFPSQYEGFGLALTEAMAVGLPAIGCENCPAVNELLADDVGILCEDSVEAIAKYIQKLIDNFELRVALGNKGRMKVKYFSKEEIFNTWDDIFRKIVNK